MASRHSTLGRFPFRFLSVITCLILLFIVLEPLLSSRVTAGWDITPHYYLAHSMAELLRAGHVSGYDTLWFAGYPSFTLYQPLTYLLAALPNFLSDGQTSVGLGFNILLVFAPFFLLFSLWFCTKKWFGSEAADLQYRLDCVGCFSARMSLISELAFIALPMLAFSLNSSGCRWH